MKRCLLASLCATLALATPPSAQMRVTPLDEAQGQLALGLLRTGELAALHRFDGAEQYFTRAVDFGYSFGIDETFEKWGRQEITADYVRLIRTIRPDVIITLPPTGNAGGQHHMASAVITRDAYTLAGDPTKFPEQIKEGLRPWQPRKLYHLAAFGFPGEPPPVGKVMRV